MPSDDSPPPEVSPWRRFWDMVLAVPLPDEEDEAEAKEGIPPQV